ncbi:MAG TPA: hypothetical protein VKX28_04115 [Xanthobacteraceae bacterium]|nr:hypothetical protein [Xanthobacteraceae bacterium]
MEPAMSGTRAIRPVAATALIAVLSLGAAQADTFEFRDMRLAHGVPRSDYVLQADEHACGADANFHFGNVAAFKKCMRAHGWSQSGYIPNAPASRRNPHLQPGDAYISTDSGMSCKDIGGIGICGAPARHRLLPQ